MEKLLLVVLLIQSFSYSILNLGFDLGIFEIESLIRINPDAKYKKLKIRIANITSLAKESSQVLNIYYCYDSIDVDENFDKTSIDKMQNLLKSFSSKSECIIYLFMHNSINFLKYQNLTTIHNSSFYKFENNYLDYCDAKSYSQALFLFNYFSTNTEIADFFSLIKQISSMYNFENFIESNFQYETKLNFLIYKSCEKSFSYSLLDIFICWVEHSINCTSTNSSNFLDLYLKKLDIKKPNCEVYKNEIEKILEEYFPHPFLIFKSFTDFYQIFEFLAYFSARIIPSSVLEMLKLIKGGIKILCWSAG